MVNEAPQVRDYVSMLPIFAFEKSDLSCTLEILKHYGTDIVPIIDEEFSIIGTLNRKQLLKIINKNDNFTELFNRKIKDFLDDNNNMMLLYARMTIFEAYSIMKCYNVKGLPVADMPWGKKIVGYLWLDEIETIVEKSCKRIPI